MPVTLTGGIGAWRQTVVITLTGLTVRASTEPFVADNGDIYKYKILGSSPLTTTTGTLLAPKVLTANMSLTFDNQPDADGNRMSDLLDSYQFANKAVVIAFGNGTDTAADFSTVFTGQVKVLGGIVFDDKQMSIQLVDQRASDELVLPANVFTTATYANLEAGAKNKPIPLIYGDWSSGVGGALKVPCYCINTTTREFKIADHAVKEISAIFKNGVAATITSSDLANATFIMTESYTAGTDTVTAHCKGATDDGTASGTLLESIPDQINDLLQTHMSIAAGNIDSTAFTNWEAELDSTMNGRRWIGTEIATSQLIAEALQDGNADMVVSADGKYTPQYRIVSLASLDSFREGDIQPASTDMLAYKVLRDPEQIFLNQCVGDYQYDPVASAYAGRHSKDNAASQSDIGQTIRRRISMNWLFNDVGGQTRTERELYYYSTWPEMIEVSFGPRMLLRNAADLFRFVYGKFVETAGDGGIPFMIRNITRDYSALVARVRAWNVLLLASGRWTATGDPVYTSSTVAQKSTNGFWTDAAGEADPGDAASAGYVWT